MAQYSSTKFLALFPLLLLYTTSAISATFSASSPPFAASNQIKFWSENVQNKMPKSILKKLSPLTQNDIKHYTSMIMSNSNNHLKFSASFCSTAKLACNATLEDVDLAKVRDIYVDEYQVPSSKNIIGTGLDHHHQKNNKYDHQDPFSFFRLSTLKNGNTIHLPNMQESLPDRAFLPLQIASKISLNIKDMTRLFPAAIKETFETTLFYCNAATIKGEMRSCPKSLEEMINFLKSALGGKKLISLSSQITQGLSTQLMVNNIMKFDTGKIVACHEVFLPFAAYYCHSMSSTNLYSVELVEPKSRAPVNTLVAICHTDTSKFPASHEVFKILKLKPGLGEACHWVTQLDLAWILDTESM